MFRKGQRPHVSRVELNTGIQLSRPLEHSFGQINSADLNPSPLQVSRNLSRAASQIARHPPIPNALSKAIEQLPIPRFMPQLIIDTVRVFVSNRVIAGLHVGDALLDHALATYFCPPPA